MGIEGQDQFVFVQNGEPGGLYCADETDGEALRVCEQISESLLAYEIGGTESVPSLAESWESNDDLTVWTFHLRHGRDVPRRLRRSTPTTSSRATGSSGTPPTRATSAAPATSQYWGALFGGFLNPPPPAED